jgi:hypothetical protein
MLVRFEDLRLAPPAGVLVGTPPGWETGGSIDEVQLRSDGPKSAAKPSS